MSKKSSTFARYIVKIMNKKLHFLVLSLVMLIGASCVTQKQMTYLRDANTAKADSLNARFESQSEVVIRNGDALTIFVSALDQEAVTPYNMPTAVYATPGSNVVQTTPTLQYYIVDEQGDIELPVLGKIHVSGLKRTAVADSIKARLEKQVVNPMVQVSLINAYVSVLGEVNRPGRVAMPTGRLTILDALASVGDLTVYGKRDNVLVTREVDGKLQMARINLHSADLINSPYYYLQQNDVIYVSPNKVRAISSANAGLWLSMVSTMASAATVIVTIVFNAKNSNSGE